MRARLGVGLLWVLVADTGCLLGMDLGGDDSAENQPVASEGADVALHCTGDTGDAEHFPCEALSTDCLAKTSLRSCDADGIGTTYDCREVCAPSYAFACVWTSPTTSGCWCIQPGPRKIYGCPELEACLDRCAGLDDGSCDSNCFAKATNSSAQLLGSLMYCASEACRDNCDAQPGQCNDCWTQARSATGGHCAEERLICNADSADSELVTGGLTGR